MNERIIEMIAILEIHALLLEVAAAPQVDDEEPRHLKRPLRAVFKADQVNGEVDPRGDARTGENITGLDK